VIRVRDENVPRDKVLKDAVEFAHNAIIDRQRTDPSTRGMGTTLTALLVNSHSAYVAHVGDSRVYQFRGGRMVFRTKDHSYVGELVQKGDLTEEQARLSARSNIITRCLGGGNSKAEVDGPLAYMAGDRFMLCTDGIWGMMPEPQLIKLVAKTKSLSGATDATVIAVDEQGRNEGNHHDNLTIALLDTTEDSILKEPMSKTTRTIIYALGALLALSLLFNFIQCGRSGGDSDTRQRVEELQEQLRQSKDSISYLKGRIQGNQEKGSDVNVFVSGDPNVTNKETDQTDNKDANNANKEQPKNDNQNSAQVNDDVDRILGVIIDQLQQARKSQNVQTRQNVCKQVVANLANLEKKDPAHKAIYHQAAEELMKAKTFRPGTEGEGQINAVIKIVSGIQNNKK
jgi:serine/threonine protein phosphatase PrpC